MCARYQQLSYVFSGKTLTAGEHPAGGAQASPPSTPTSTKPQSVSCRWTTITRDVFAVNVAFSGYRCRFGRFILPIYTNKHSLAAMTESHLFTFWSDSSKCLQKTEFRCSSNVNVTRRACPTWHATAPKMAHGSLGLGQEWFFCLV